MKEYLRKLPFYKPLGDLYHHCIDYPLSRFNYHISCKRMAELRSSGRVINFVFVLYDLATWKSEDLYLAMLKHPRFNPILAVTKNTSLKGHEKDVINYLLQKDYPYVYLDDNRRIVDQIEVDMLMYQRPYLEFSPLHYWKENRKAVLVRMGYGFHSLLEPWLLMMSTSTNAWQDYYENDLCVQDCLKATKGKRFNLVVTGIPTMDWLAQPKDAYPDPWKNKDTRKRIIWAPHHSTGNAHMKGIAFGTFLEIADDMLKLAKEYSDRVYWTFKPHPVLRSALSQAGWTDEDIDNYYNQWNNLGFSQFEEGEYMGLFKHSDAMIHDCSSFTMEYLCTGNPVLYVVRPEHQLGNTNRMTQQSFEKHYHATDMEGIRQFIENVIADADPRKEERISFVNQYLRPPHGKTACENIMNAILGVEEYTNC